MVSNVNKQWIVEFNGLPGSGKTTAVSELEKIIKSQGYKVLTLKDVYFYNENRKSSTLITVSSAIFSLSSIKLNYRILKFLLSFKLSKAKVLYALRAIKLHYQLKLVNKEKKFDIIILEEGLIQYFSSIPHTDKIINQKELMKLFLAVWEPFDKILLINCDIDIGSANRRINSRSDKNRRFDAMSNKERTKGLEVNNQNIIKMREASTNKSSISINMEKSEKEIVNTILHYIENIIKR